ncbi:mucin-binding protein [Levilactobacillus brevis]
MADNATTTAAAGDNTKTDNTATTTDTGNSTKTDNTATTTDTGNSTKTDNTATTAATGDNTKTDNTATTAATGDNTKTDNTATTAATGDNTKTDNTATTTAVGDSAKTDSIMASSAANNNLPNSTTVQVSYQNLLTQLSSSSELNADSEALTNVTKDNFEDYFSLNGSATYDQTTGIVTITPDENNKVGNFSLKSKIDMNTSFTLTGQINLGNRTSSQGGADGIGFAFHTGNTTDIGNAGGNLGIGGLQKAIGFKLDTCHNGYRTPQANEDGAQVASTDSNGYGWDTDPDGTKFPQFGAFVNTSQKLVKAQDGHSYSRWWATTDMSSVQELNSGDLDGQSHDFVVSYDGSNRKLTIKYTETGGNVLTWSTSIPDAYQAMAMVVSASTGGFKNLQQFKISSFDFKQAATVNVKYVDQKGNRLAQGTVSYPSGADVNGTYDTTSLNIPNYTFIKMSDSDITGGTSLPASGTLENPGDNGTVIYVYAPAYSTTMKTVNETIKYVNQNGETVSASHTATPINFLTVTNPVDGSTATYYSKTESGQPTLDNNGVPVGDWTQGNSTDFAAIINPSVIGQHVVSTTDPGNDLTQTTVKRIDSNSDNLDFTVTYTSNQEAANVTYIDDTTGKTLSAKDLTGDYGSTDPYRTGDTIADYEKQGYQLVSDNYPTNGVVYNQDGTVQSFEVHLTHGTTPVGPNNPQTPGTPINPDEPNGPKWPISTNYDKTVNETVSYVDQNGHVVAKQHTDSVNFTRTVVVDNVTGEVITSGAGTTAWTATNGDTTFDAVVSPVVSGSVANKAQTAAVTDLNANSANVNETVTYTKVGSLVPSSSDGNFPGAPTVVYPNDPSDATKVTPAGVPTVPGYTAHDPEGHVLTPGSSYQPSDPTKDTTITYTADKQKGSVSYVDDTTGKTLKTDPISGTTGSKSSYSTSGSIADYKKQGYELVTDGYPADLTFDNDDTTDQNFTVHLKHQLTPVNPTNPQTPGAPINPDEPNGPKWPISTNYDKTVNETVSYVDQNGHVVAKQHTDSVNFTRTVVVDNVTGEVITSGAGTTAWTATNGDTTFDAVVSPVVSGSVANKAQTAAVTDLNADSADVNETVTYTKVGSLVPSSSDGNFPGAPTVVYPNDPSDATKVTPAGVPTVPGYTAHDPEGHVLTPGSSYQPSDPTKDTTITYTADKQKGSVSYVDDTTGKTLKTDPISGTTGSKSSYSTSGSIADYKKQGYELVTDGYPADLTFDNDDTTDQNFTVHLKHQLTPVNPMDPQTPGAPINPDEPDGPKWPEGTDKSSVTQTVIRTVNYLDKQTGKVVAKQVTEQVTYNRTAIVDKVTDQIIGYSTTGGDTVDQTDGDKAWTAVDNKSDWDSVTSPDLSSKGYLAPDLATVAQQTVTPGDKDVTVKVYYDHDVVPVNPTNPQTPGTPINPDDPDSPKWPAGTDKNSLTTDVHQTIHYQYGDGSQAAPDKTDSTTFDHQVEIDKVTGEIVKDDGWTAENGKTSFDSKNSPVIPGYTASKPASDSVDGLTQDSKDNVQTIVYAKTPVAGGNVTAKYVDENGNPIADDVIASGNVGDPYSTTQKDVPGYTFKEVQGNPTGSFTDQDQTVTYVYTKNPATDNNGGTGPNQPGKPGNGTDTGNPSSNQPGNPSQPSNATNNGVINTSTNTGSKVNNGAVNSPELPQTGENNSQSQTMSFIGILLAMFGSLLGFLGIKKRRND